MTCRRPTTSNGPRRSAGLGALAALSFAALAFLATGTAGETLLERFELFADCQPMVLVVERMSPDASEIGLTEESILAAAESRLRAARLYDAEATHYLYVNVNVAGPAFSLSLEFNKPFYDPLSDTPGLATTWDIGVTGTHGGNAGYILSNVSQHMDRFLVEFLRVNEAECG